MGLSSFVVFASQMEQKYKNPPRTIDPSGAVELLLLFFMQFFTAA